MLFRAGTGWSHWDTDALNVILYGKGAPLSPGTGYQYYSGNAQRNGGIYHNRVKVGRRDLQEIFGRVDGSISDYGFGANVDYAVADRFYPKQLFKDGKGAMIWRRHVMFMKSPKPTGPSYFIMRDSFPVGESRTKWWNWLNPGTPDAVAVEGQSFAKDVVGIEKVIPVEKMVKKDGQKVTMNTAFGASTQFWFSRKCRVRVRGIMQEIRHRKDSLKTIIEIPAGVGEDFFYAVLPVKHGEKAPSCKVVGDGVMQVTTSESVDTVFIGDKSFNYKKGDVRFTGKAGAVRVFGDRVVLSINAGWGQVGYKGHVVSGYGPFEQVIGAKDLKEGVHELEGGYEKKMKTVDLGRGVVVKGEAPFDAKLDGDVIKISSDGRARILHVSQPTFIIRPQLFINGMEWMACWTDYPASGWGSYDNTWLIGLSVPAGKQQLVLKNMAFPEVWQRQFEQLTK
jgi:hypothetical protein